MSSSPSPASEYLPGPRAPPPRYGANSTRWEKEKAAAGPNAFEYPEDPKAIGPWIVGETVGKGASGRVKIARHCRTGKLAAVKIISAKDFAASRASIATQAAKAEKQRHGIDREIVMMKLMDHPNIMGLYDVWEGDKELYLILEYVEGGELFDYLVNRGRLPVLEALNYFKQIIRGLQYCHSYNIIHRDLKPENILMCGPKLTQIKIADWGMATLQLPQNQLETSCGSPHYASPEIVNGEKYEGAPSDIWSCGVILYALMTGRLPFDDKNVRHLLEKVKMGKYHMPSWIHSEAKDLIEKMLTVDVRMRITMPEILAHPFMQFDTPSIPMSLPPSYEELSAMYPIVKMDKDIIKNLQVILGKDTDTKALIDQVYKNERSLVKMIYFLLARYRDRGMEEYMMNEDDYRMPPPSYSTRPQPGTPQRKAPPPPSLGSPKKRQSLQVQAQAKRAADGRPLRASTLQPPAKARPTSQAMPPPGIFVKPAPRESRKDQPNAPVVSSPLASPAITPTGAPKVLVPMVITPDSDEKGGSQKPQALGATDNMRDQPRTAHSKATASLTWIPDDGDKENSRKSKAPSSKSSTSAAPVARPTPSNMKDSTTVTEVTKARREGEKRKSRPAPLDLSNPTRKQSVLVAQGPVTPLLSPLPSPLPSPFVVNELRGWFTNLFNWKAPSYVLYSYQNCLTTRDEVARILETHGVRTQLEDAEGWGILRCLFEEEIGEDGFQKLKPVRFRVEFVPVGNVRGPTPGDQSPMPEEGFNGYVSTLTLIQEKGALSTFKEMYGNLKDAWRLDSPRSPNEKGQEMVQQHPSEDVFCDGYA